MVLPYFTCLAFFCLRLAVIILDPASRLTTIEVYYQVHRRADVESALMQMGFLARSEGHVCETGE